MHHIISNTISNTIILILILIFYYAIFISDLKITKLQSFIYSIFFL